MVRILLQYIKIFRYLSDYISKSNYSIYKILISYGKELQNNNNKLLNFLEKLILKFLYSKPRCWDKGRLFTRGT